MPTVYISVGSNIKREYHIHNAIRQLKSQFGSIRCSPVYESPAVGFHGDNFYNMVIAIDTQKSVEDLAAILRHIEDANGRIRGSGKFLSRTLDLDLLTYDDLVLQTPDIVIPRQEILQQAFVLLPLAEIAPESVHPIVGKKYAQLWHEFSPKDQPIWRVAMEVE